MNGAKPYERRQKVRDVEKTFELREDTERLYACIQGACQCDALKDRNIGLGLAVHHHNQGISPDLSFRMLLYDKNDDVCSLSVKMTRRSSSSEEPPKKRMRYSVVDIKPATATCRNMKKLGEIC